MALPSGGSQISIGQIRTQLRPEGSNSDVNLGGYYRGSGNVGSSFANLQTQLLSSSQSDVKMSAFWAGSYIEAANVGASRAASEASPANCTLGVGFQANGRVLITENGGIQSTSQGIEPYEQGPPGAADWEVRVTKTGGNTSFSAGSNNTWEPLGASWEVLNTSDAEQDKQVVVTIEMRTKSNTTVRYTQTGVSWIAGVYI